MVTLSAAVRVATIPTTPPPTGATDMARFQRLLATTFTLGVAGLAAAQDVAPASWPPRQPVCPPTVQRPICPPSTAPGMPGMPGTPGTPMLPPGTPDAANPLAPVPPGSPDAAAPQIPGASNLAAEAPARGTGSGGTLLPNVNGDLLGGGGIAGPLPVLVAPNGQFVGRLPVVVLPNGQRVTLGAQNSRATDELLRNRSQNFVPPGSRVVAVFPPAGAVFAEEFADAVVRVPQIVRGPFKVTENESPRPRTRAYFSYYFYDQVFRDHGGANTPRVQVHQEVFGYEQSFLDDRASVGIRLPYNQLVSTGFYNQTSLADVTITTKFTLYDEGNLFVSGGLLVTPPTAGRPFASTITGQRIGGTLVQPYLGYIYRNEDWYAQGFSSITVPTDSRDVTLLANDLQLGYIAYTAPGAFLSSLVPTVELHVNTPLDHRGPRVEPVGFTDQVTVLGGLQTVFRDKAGFGFSVGAPVTGPRPFSLQATVQFNYWF